MSTLIHTVQFNGPVYFVDHTGISFVNTTTAEVATGVSSVTPSGSDTIEYSVTWVLDPVPGDVIDWVIAAEAVYTGDKVDAGSLEIINCANFQAANGFLPYPSGSALTVIQADLTDVTLIDGADAQGGGQTFTAEGMESGTVAGLRWTGKPNQGGLDVEGVIRFECEKGWFDDTVLPAAVEYISSHDGGPVAGWTLYKRDVNGRMICQPEGTFANNNDIPITLTGKGTHVLVQIYFDANHITICYDGLPVLDLIEVGTLAGRFLNYILGGDRTLLDRGAHGYRIRNVEVIAEQPVFPAHPFYGDICFFGDSITNRGNLSAESATPVAGDTNEIWFSPGLGFSVISDPVAPGNPGLMRDVGLQSTFFRDILNSQQLVPSSNCNNASCPGENTEQCLVRVNTFFDGGGTANLVNILIGTNDATSGGNAIGAPALAAFESNYKLIITKCFDSGVRNMSMGIIPTLNADPLFASDGAANVDAINAIINTLPAWAQDQGYGTNFIRLVDYFTALGGHTDWAPYYIEGDIHPNEDGNVVMGQLLASVALATIT